MLVWKETTGNSMAIAVRGSGGTRVCKPFFRQLKAFSGNGAPASCGLRTSEQPLREVNVRFGTKALS
jgi:hypothetical protein